MSEYLNALVADPTPQTIPQGFAGHYDWDAIDDAEKARRGWVRAQLPAVDPDFERVAVELVEGEDGWQASYKVVPGDIEYALKAALAKVSARRWQAEVGGIVLDGMSVPTDRETQAIVDRICKAFDDGDITGEVNFKAPLGFVTVGEATMKAIKRAGAQHVQACFDRESEISALLSAKRKTETVRATLAEELDKGWPGQAADQG